MKSLKSKRSGFALFTFLTLSLVFDTFIFFTLFSAIINLFVIVTWNFFVVGAVALSLALLGQLSSTLRLHMPSFSVLNYFPRHWLVGLAKMITGYSEKLDDVNSNNFLLWLIAYSSPMYLSSHFFESLKERGSKVVRQLIASGYSVSKIREFNDIPDKMLPVIEKYPEIYQNFSASPFYREILRICKGFVNEGELPAINRMLPKITELSDQIAKLKEDSLRQIRMFTREEQAYILKSLGNVKPPVVPRLQSFVKLVKDLNSVKAVQKIININQDIDDLNRSESQGEAKEVFTSQQMKTLHHLFDLNNKKLDMRFIGRLGTMPEKDGMFAKNLKKAISILGEENCVVYASKSLLETLCDLDEGQITEVTRFTEAQKQMLVCHFEHFNAFWDIEDKEKCELVISWVKEHEALSPAYLKIAQLEATDRKVVDEKIEKLHVRSLWSIMEYISYFKDEIKSEHIVSLFEMPFRKRHLIVSFMREGQRLALGIIKAIRRLRLSPRVFSGSLEPIESYLDGSHHGGVVNHATAVELQELVENNTEANSESAFSQSSATLGGSNVFNLFESKYKEEKFLKYAEVSDEDIERVWVEASSLLVSHDFDNTEPELSRLRAAAAVRLIRCFEKSERDLDSSILIHSVDMTSFWAEGSSMKDTFKLIRTATIFLWKIGEHAHELCGEDPRFADQFKKSIIEFMAKDPDTCPYQLINSLWQLATPYFFSDVYVPPKVDTVFHTISSICKQRLGDRDKSNTLLSESEYTFFVNQMISGMGQHLDVGSINARKQVEIEHGVEEKLTNLANSYQEFGPKLWS